MRFTQHDVQLGSDSRLEDRDIEHGLEQGTDWDVAGPQMDQMSDTPVAVASASTAQDYWLTPSELYIG